MLQIFGLDLHNSQRRNHALQGRQNVGVAEGCDRESGSHARVLGVAQMQILRLPNLVCPTWRPERWTLARRWAEPLYE